MCKLLPLVVAALMCAIAACTSVDVSHRLTLPAGASPVQVASVVAHYGKGLQVDRRERAEENNIAGRVAQLVEAWMKESGQWGGADSVAIEISEFRLPASGTRWLTGQLKGNDYLGATVIVSRDAAPLTQFQVTQTLGAMDRSIGENYSADWALDNLIEAVAWSIAFELTPVPQRAKILDIGKREEVQAAIDENHRCGRLSFMEGVKYSALGLLSFSTAAGSDVRRIQRAFGYKTPNCP